MATRTARHRPAQRATKPATVVPAPSHRTRVLGVGLAVYLGILATMVVFDSYTFVLKSAVVPFLLVAAVLSHRFGGFVNDWAVFLGLVVLFDSLRSVVFAVTTHFELPMYAGYAIAWERWLCGGAIAPVIAQQLRAALSNPHSLDRFFVLLHASHFLFFLLFGFVLWYIRRDAFRTYAAAMVALLYLALLAQFLVPTIPPWLAARDFMLLPPTVRIMRSVYNVHLPSLVAVFDVNPIAAMPSLHAAMPTLCALSALHYLGWAGVPVVAYAIGVWAAVIYLGEHYLVDVVAGAVLALLIYAGIRRWGAPPGSVGVPDERSLGGRLAPRPIVVALLLVAGAFGFGQLATVWLGPLPITRAFVERELVDRSPGAHYLLGRIAFDEGDFARAQRAFTRAASDLPRPAEQKVVRSFLGRSAHHAGDFPAAIAALEPLRAATDQVVDLVMLARAYVDDKQYEQGVSVLREARQRFPTEPEPLYWLTRLQYLHGQIGRVDVSQSIEALRALPPAMRGGRQPAANVAAVRPMPDYSLFGDEHVRQYEATGGKVGHDWNGTSCLILHTRGRKSGAIHKIPLIYGRDGEDYVLVASKGGAPEHPGWYKNLVAHPNVDIQIWDKVIPVTARTGTAADKKRVWPIMTAQWPGYDEYQAGTPRDIPVVLLRPR